MKSTFNLLSQTWPQQKFIIFSYIKKSTEFYNYISLKKEIYDENTGQLYKKTWTNNMRDSKKERISHPKGKKGYTKVTWIPDFEKFKIDKYNKTILSIYYRYVYDASMLTGVNVYLNDKKISFKNLTDYAKCYGEHSEMLSFKSKDAIRHA